MADAGWVRTCWADSEEGFMSVSCPSLWSAPGHSVFWTEISRDLSSSLVMLVSTQCCAAPPDPFHTHTPHSSCLRPAHPRSLTQSLFRALWIEVRPSCARRPLPRLHPLWSPFFFCVGHTGLDASKGPSTERSAIRHRFQNQSASASSATPPLYS